MSATQILPTITCICLERFVSNVLTMDKFCFIQKRFFKTNKLTCFVVFTRVNSEADVLCVEKKFTEGGGRAKRGGNSV